MMKVAIIGAGLASLLAASELQKRGASVQVFEKSRGRGGRLCTKRLDWGRLDIGAQYFTARSERFKQSVERWARRGYVQIWNFTPFKLVGGTLQTSPDSIARYVGTPDMSSIGKALSQDLRIKYQTRITAIEHKPSGWTLKSADNEEFRGFDRLVLGLPAEQARALIAGHSDIVRQIPEQVHWPCWALGLATKGEVPDHIRGFFGDDTISWVSRLNSKPMRESFTGYSDLWMLHFAPLWSQVNGKNSTSDITALGKEWLESALQTRLTLINHYQHFWRYANIRDVPAIAPFLWDERQQLAVIGAWCCGEIGRAHV